MPVYLIDKIQQFGGGTFKLLDAEDLDGAFVKSVAGDDSTGVITITFQDGTTGENRVTAFNVLGAPASVFVDAIRYGLIVFQDRLPTESDFAHRRMFFDGITLRKIRRTPVPGHDRVVVFRQDNLGISQYGTGIYVNRQAADDVPGTPSIGERYYNRNQAHWEIWEAGNYWDTSQFIAAPVDAQGRLWVGEFNNEAAAAAQADRADEIAAYPDDDGIYVLHRVVSVTAGTEDGFRYELEPVLEVFALSNAEVDDDESDVQGTVSGRTLARAVGQHERFTEVEQEILDDLSRITFPRPTDDWAIRQSYNTRDFFADRYATFLSLGWDTDNRLRALSADGHVARLGGHNRGRIYDGGDRLRAGLISGDHWLFLRDNETHGGSDIERAPVNGGDSAVEFEINTIRYFTMFADPDSGTLLGILRRISADDMEVGLLAYDAAQGTVTAEDTITLTRAHINAALGADFASLTDIHRESAGGAYEGVAGAVLEGDTLYLLLTHIFKTDGHTTSALVGFTLAGTPNNRTLTVLAENAVDELPIPDELTSGILPLEADELFIASDTAAYRLSPPEEIDQSDWDETDSDSHAYIKNTDEPKAQLTDIANLERKTGDLIVHTTRTWTDAADAEVTGFAGRPASLADITGETYHGSLTQGAAEDYIVVRIPLANDLRDYRVNQTGTSYEHNWQNLELIDTDATFRYGGTFTHVVGGSTIRAQYSAEQVHTSYRGDIGLDRPTAQEIADGTSVDPAASSVSDIVAIGNVHTRHSLADSDPEDVGETASEGTGGAVSRVDHVHRFPHDNTIDYDDANEQFGVSVHDVTEHLQESVQYYADSPYDYSQGGGESEGQVYTTSAFDKTITRVRIRLVPAFPSTRYEARILQVHDDNRVHSLLGTSQFRTLDAGGSHHFDFVASTGEVGIPIAGGTRIAVILSRLGGGNAGLNRGTESSSSPRGSYDDARHDFVQQNSVVYDSDNPPVDHGTHSHGDSNDIRGNIEIFYILHYDHGHLVGDGNINAAHIDSESADDGQVLTADGVGGSAWEDAPAPAGGGSGAFARSVLFEDTTDRVAVGNSVAVILDLDSQPASGSDIEIQFRENSGSTTIPANAVYPIIQLPADTWMGLDPIVGTETNTDGMYAGVFKRPNNSFVTTGLVSYCWVGRTALNQLVLRVSSASEFDLEFRIRVREVQPSGGGSSQQAGGGQNLTRSTVVSGNLLSATNALTFDVAGSGVLAVGNYSINPIPILDLFDLVATIRVGGRAGYSMRLSREQFFYVGETQESVAGAWPFGGSGGGSWGNVSELPCAMLSVDHRSEGAVKTQLRPQRQQLGWNIGGTNPRAAILFFFDFDAGDTNLTNVRLVAFSDQIVEIEGIHIHYWQGS